MNWTWNWGFKEQKVKGNDLQKLAEVRILFLKIWIVVNILIYAIHIESKENHNING